MKSDPLITYRRKPATLDGSSLEAFAVVLRDRVLRDRVLRDRVMRNRLARGREFHCRITNDAELQSLNKQFLGNDYPTDVLSFPSENDIAISFERARAQAREWKHSTEDEIRILMLHGVLHLAGMDHESDTGQMKRTELRWRKKFGLPTCLIERAK
jgi:probable rRNA maturation factor